MKKIFAFVFLMIFSFINLQNGLVSAQTVDSSNIYNGKLGCVTISNNLGYGSRDSYTNGEVSDLQFFLQDRGYLNIEPTGYFGRITQSAVISYQSAKGISALGYVGPITRTQIQADSCGGVNPNPTPNPIICTMEARLCNDGSVMPRDPNCTWRPDRCPISNPSDYTIDLSIYSSNLNKYLSKNTSGYFDATGVDGQTTFTISTSNTNANCVTYTKSDAYSNYNLSSPISGKTFSQSYNKNGLGLDYYKVSCGDGVYTKKVEKEFIVETKASYTPNTYYCSINGQTYYNLNDYNNYCKFQNSYYCSLNGITYYDYNSYVSGCKNTQSYCPTTADFSDSAYPGCVCPFGYTKTRTDYYTGSYNYYCSNNNNPMPLKPVIYLYPTSSIDVNVKLSYDGGLITYPRYDDVKGWNVTANPDGTLKNKADNKEYSYLFWEGIPNKESEYDMNTGFVVKGKDIDSFLQDKLAKLGLTPKEYNEFIVFWYPKLMNNKYNIIHFATKGEYDDKAKLSISPKPDSVLRVFMVAKGVNDISNLKVKEQEIKPFVRNGFTVVEWGGTELK